MTTFINTAIIKAQPKAQRFVISFFLGMLSFGWLSIFSAYLVQQTQEETTQSTPVIAFISHALLLTAILMTLGLVAFTAWFGQRGIQSLRQGCYPPTNAIVVCDTLLVTGWRASVKALAAMMLAIASLLGSITIGFEIVGFLNL